MRFEVGARVRTLEPATDRHTRLPRYLATRKGRVVALLGEFRFADEAAERGAQASKQRLYTVEFADGPHTVHADLFESYLEPDV